MTKSLKATLCVLVFSVGLANPLTAAEGDANNPFDKIIADAGGLARFEDGLTALDRGDYATALRILLPLADQGKSDAQFAVGKIYFEGDGVPQSDAAAARWFRLAAEQGVVGAQSILGFMYLNGRGLPQDDAAALKWLRLAANRGVADSQWRLGDVYRRGEGVPQDFVLALMWFNLSAAQDKEVAYSRDELAKIMLPAQIAEAQKLAREWKPVIPAAQVASRSPPSDTDDPFADLPQVYAPSKGAIAAPVTAGAFEDAAAAYKRGDYATALGQFHFLADKGDARAENNLGVMYYAGQGMHQDYNEAARWFRLAADQGDANAQTSLGAMYVAGQGVPQDYTEGVRWYRLAADQSYPVAEMNLGALYFNGQGVPQDYAEAAKWYRLSADQGYADAQFALGAFYEEGRGVPRDYVRAYVWYSLAAALYPASDAKVRKEAIAFRDQLVVKMTPEQIAEAQKLEREWKPISQRPG